MEKKNRRDAEVVLALKLFIIFMLGMLIVVFIINKNLYGSYMPGLVKIKNQQETVKIVEEPKPVEEVRVEKKVITKPKVVKTVRHNDVPTLKPNSGLDKKKVREYANVFSKLTVDQKMYFVAAYSMGRQANMGITQAAIVWKESHYGKSLINDKDGLYGSYGLGQILLTTSMSRNNVKSAKDRQELRRKLITDHVFNLEEGLHELVSWKKVHKDKLKRKDWLIWTIASYNNGHKSYTDAKGKKYADDVRYRIEAIKLYFYEFKGYKNSKLLNEYFTSIKYDIFPDMKRKY